MTVNIVIPEDLWEEDSEAVITNWLSSSGARVQKGDVIAEIMTEKIQHDIQAPADGTLIITKEVDEIVRKGDVIGTVS